MNGLKDKINLALNEEKRAYSANGRIGGGLGSFNIGIGGGWTTVGQIPKLISEKSSLEAISSPNTTVLLKLHSSLNSSDKDEFTNILLSYLSKESPYLDVSYLIFFVLHRIGKTIEAIQQARKHLKGDSKHGFSNMLGIFSKIIQNEHSFISGATFEAIKKAMEGEDEHNFQLFEIINSAELLNLSVQLEANNPEVNEDKEILKRTFQKYSFPSDLSETLDKIDEKLNNARDTFDYKGCMDLIRSFTERFYKSVAIGLEKDSGNKLDEKDSEKVARFLKEKGVISDDQGKILVALRHFLSNFGSHRLKSRPEDARLSRNMTIEFSLYITRRYEDVVGVGSNP